MIGWLRDVVVYQSDRLGWRMVLAGRLTGAALGVVLVAGYGLLTGESVVGELIGVALSVPLIYLVGWVWRWCIWYRERKVRRG
jgi:ABC-type uncharacterized transport system permease subunit